MQARVIEIVLDKYRVSILGDNKEALVKSRGNVKKNSYIKVGDIVVLSDINNEYIITDILDRKNDYVRPPVANVDYIFIVIAAGSPKPDFLLLDKQIITAERNNSIPIIVLNKMDLENSEKTKEYVENTYQKLGYKVIYTSATYQKLISEEEFRNIEAGSLCAFSGNSGVGKSSIISRIKEDMDVLSTNSVSEKTGKGRHTTKAVTAYDVVNNNNDIIYFLDTPGFSSFDLYNISSKDLKKYFNEFGNYTCDYEDCNHINEQEKYCSVKQAVKDNKVDSLRYEHYLKIHSELVEKEKRLYR